MAVAWTSVAPSLAVAVVLLGLAALLLAHSHRDLQNLLLAALLLVVGVGFAADALATATGLAVWTSLDYATSSLDPLLFLAFTTEHPYVRRTRLHRVALVWLALAGAACAAIAFLDLPSIDASAAPPLSPIRLLFVLGLGGLAYTLGWAASVAALRHAPTDGLAQRARWSCLAIGVALVPRLPYVPVFQLKVVPGGSLADLAVMLALVAVLTVPAWRALRHAQQPRAARRVVAAVAAVSVLLSVLHAAPLLGVGFHHAFALRWALFSGVLVYAVLAHQIVQFPAVARRVLPILGAAVAGLFAASAAASLLPTGATTPQGTAVVAGSAGFGGAALGAWAVRALLGWAERTPGPRQAERRLALYGAAVEAALAGGTEGRLARMRLQLGLSREEARAVEGVVRRALDDPGRTLRAGDEALPGIVLERPLSGGTQAATFLARRLPDGTRVTVKQLPPLRPGARGRLWRELDALSALRHPCLPLLAGVALDPVPCVAYEYVPGRTLAEALRRGRPSGPRLRAAASDLAGALAAVHAAGFAHGDVKPSNVVLGRDGRAHLIDFGLAEARPPPRATLAGDVPAGPAGTLEYMAPELAARGVPTPTSDVFALGMTVLHALTGRSPRSLDGLAVYQALDCIAREPVAVEGVPARWQPFLRACLDPDPARRPPASALAALVPAPRASSRARRPAAAPTP